jgi:phospholipid/cholesterol/gamma-HCH transport system permease protein
MSVYKIDIMTVIANRVSEDFERVGQFWRFIGRSFLVSFFSCLRPSVFPLVLTQMFIIGVRSVPVVMVTGAFVGMTLAVQAYDQLAYLGVEERLGALINISGVKELGPVLAAIMLAGRVGGALTAELGTMKVTEQIEAIKSMGVDPYCYLVAPRVLACLLLAPVLIIYAVLLCSLGGYFVSVYNLGIPSRPYWDYSAAVVELWDIGVGIVKGFFFGAAIAVISCYKGFTCENGAQGVGKACTEAFVASFISILALDFMLVVIFKAIYNTIWPLRSMF